MADYIKVGTISELVPGAMKEFTVKGVPVLVVRIEDTFYAIQGRCPHLGGILAQGKLEGAVITCPKHNSQFAVTDGRVIRWLKGTGLISSVGKVIKSPRVLKTYSVKVESGDILVQVE